MKKILSQKSFSIVIMNEVKNLYSFDIDVSLSLNMTNRRITNA
jgi:hypothetical protein